MSAEDTVDPGGEPDVGASASAYFGAMADEYDSLIRRAVPRYDEMIDRLVAYSPGSAARVLELGCGTGNFSLRLAACYPDAAITFVDAAPEMLETTRERLASAGHSVRRFAFVPSRFEDLAFEDGAFDLVASCISLHHVLDKATLFGRLRGFLVGGGAFRFADQFAGATARNHAINWERWLAFCRLPGHTTEEELAGLVEHAERHDHYVPLLDHFRMLEEAGFVGLDCVWRDGMWGVVTADLPKER